MGVIPSAARDPYLDARVAQPRGLLGEAAAAAKTDGQEQPWVELRLFFSERRIGRLRDRKPPRASARGYAGLRVPWGFSPKVEFLDVRSG